MKFLRPIIAGILIVGSITPINAMDEVKKPYKPVGLKNPNSYCFMNAAVQVLRSMTDITDVIEESMYKKDSLALTFCDLLPQLRHSKEVIDPSVLCFKGWKQMRVKEGEQSDANEFLAELLTCLSHKDLSEDIWATFDLSKPIESQTAIGPLFNICTATTLFCESEGYFEDPRKEPVACLSLQVNKGSKSLDDCLEDYLDPEEQFTRIPNVEDLVIAKRQRFIESTQQYLICGFDRRGYEHNAANGKDELQLKYIRRANPISFPLYDFRMTHLYAEKAQGPYELIGVMMHRGTAQSGHYTAYVKAGNQWHYCDDSVVRMVNEEDVFKIAKSGHGELENDVPATLVYQLSETRADYPPAKQIVKAPVRKPQPVKRVPKKSSPPRRTPNRTQVKRPARKSGQSRREKNFGFLENRRYK